MTSGQFDARVRDESGVAVIELHGEIDGGADAVLASAHARAKYAAAIVLNFAEVDYVNSTGLALIVRLLARARENRQDVRACGLSDHYREIFEITRLANFMTICDDEPSAVAAASDGRT